MTPSGAGTAHEGRHLRLQRLLLAWYHTEARQLAWRSVTDPYRVLVSEFMLQQTQAARVEPVFLAFVRSFPDVRSLAAASRADVLRAWEGLGYNRRAVSLHRAARVVVDEHGGHIPDDLEALTALPGIGDYTARAVLAFAFGQDVAPLDVNVARVVARAAVGAPVGRTELQRVADELVPPGQASEWASALMDLGARYCVSRTPRCPACPVAAACAWRATADVGSDTTPDPAAASGVRSRVQGPFAGSDRYHRGKLVDTLRRGPVELDALPSAAGLDDTGRLVALTRDLVDEGLAEWDEGALRLPNS